MKKTSTLVALCMVLFTTTTRLAAQAVFTDAYATGVTFAAFDNSKNDITIDNTVFQSGTSSLKIVVPAAGYTGGALVAATPQNLATYNAVSFWIKGSAAKTLNVAGVANSAVASAYQTELEKIAVTTAWTKVIIPIAAPAKLTAETGLFHFAEGSEEGAYTIWLDNIQLENLATTIVGTPTASIATEAVTKGIGDAFEASGFACSFPVNGVATVLKPAKANFTFTSGTPAVATIDALGVGKAVSAGTSLITAKLGAVAATGTLTVNVTAVSTPTTAAPVPTRPAASVISLFSNTYTNKAVDTWSAVWDQADVADVQIAGNDTKKYTNLVYAGIEFVGPNLVDAKDMNYFHIDIWTPNSTLFKIKLVDFGANKIYQGTPNDDTEHELSFTPKLGEWVSYNIPLSDFTGMKARQSLAQMILSGSTATMFMDNIYFFKTGVGTNDVTFAKNLFTVDPSVSEANFRVNLTENVKGSAQIMVTNVAGQTVYNQSITTNGAAQTQTISTKGLTAGLYVVSVRVGTSMQTEKVVVAH